MWEGRGETGFQWSQVKNLELAPTSSWKYYIFLTSSEIQRDLASGPTLMLGASDLFGKILLNGKVQNSGCLTFFVCRHSFQMRILSIFSVSELFHSSVYRLLNATDINKCYKNDNLSWAPQIENMPACLSCTDCQG